MTRTTASRFHAAWVSALLCLIAGAPRAQADDSEVFTSTAFASGYGVCPNILFILDTSGSVNEIVQTYDPPVTYTGPCPTDRVYWRTENSEAPPDCTMTTQWITTSANTCNAATSAFGTNGWWRGRTQQFNPAVNQWQNARAGASAHPFECQADSGVHGPNAASTARWARNHADRRTSNSSQSINWSDRQTLSLYSANYANFWFGAAGAGTLRTR